MGSPVPGGPFVVARSSSLASLVTTPRCAPPTPLLRDERTTGWTHAAAPQLTPLRSSQHRDAHRRHPTFATSEPPELSPASLVTKRRCAPPTPHLRDERTARAGARRSTAAHPLRSSQCGGARRQHPTFATSEPPGGRTPQRRSSHPPHSSQHRDAHRQHPTFATSEPPGGRTPQRPRRRSAAAHARLARRNTVVRTADTPPLRRANPPGRRARGGSGARKAGARRAARGSAQSGARVSAGRDGCRRPAPRRSARARSGAR